jgi:hypothetical protein
LFVIASCAAHVTSDIIEQIRRALPDDNVYNAIQAVVRGELSRREFVGRLQGCRPISPLDDILRLLSGECDQFVRLAAEGHAYQQEVDNDQLIGSLQFRSGSHEEVLAWKPFAWTIPTEDEISAMGKLDAQTPPSNHYLVKSRYLFHEPAPNPFGYSWYERPSAKHHFSAAAAAICFLQSLTTETRM